MSKQDPDEIARTKATVRRGWWPGWIWAIPIAALLLVGWWGFRALTSGGEDITIKFTDAHELKEGNTSVVYRGMVVGKVTGITLAKDGSAVDVTAQIQDSASKFLKSGTRFWLRGANPSLSNFSSLAAVLSGPTIVMEPGPGNTTKQFTGLTHKPVTGEPHDQPEIYQVSLKGDVGGLKIGDPVKLRGFPVGEVKEIGFHYDASTGELATPVSLALYPSLFRIDGASVPDDQAALKSAIDRLVQQGLRARLERDPPLVGSPEVTLDVVPGAPSAPPPSLANGTPQIPAAPESGLDSIVNRINQVPIDQIAQNVLDITHHVDTLVASPKLDDAVAQLDAALQQIHETADNAGPKIAKLVDSLRNTAGQLDRTAKAADKLLGGAPGQAGTQQAMREITEAARSVRELADYLDRHPEGLLEGRSGE